MTNYIERCIRLEQEPVSEGNLLSQRISFVLNRPILAKLLEMHQQSNSIILPASFLARWRHAALFDGVNRLRTTWSFCLFYEGQGVLKTSVAMDGRILHQVCADILPQATLYQQLSSVHYWLIQELFKGLHWRRPQGKWTRPVAWGLAIAFFGLMTVFNLSKLLAQPVLWIPALISLYLLQWGINKILRWFLPKLESRLIYETFNGVLTKNASLQRWGLSLLQRL